MGEVIAIIGMVCSGIMFISTMITEKWGGALIFLLLFVVNGYCYKLEKDESLSNQKVETYKTIKCKDFKVDSTIVISGADTTKTYVINYLE